MAHGISHGFFFPEQCNIQEISAGVPRSSLLLAHRCASCKTAHSASCMIIAVWLICLWPLFSLGRRAGFAIGRRGVGFITALPDSSAAQRSFRFIGVVLWT
jgi:hypothetical protein